MGFVPKNNKKVKSLIISDSFPQISRVKKEKNQKKSPMSCVHDTEVLLFYNLNRNTFVFIFTASKVYFALAAGTILWKYNKNTYIIRTPFSRRHHRRNSKNLFFIYSQSVDKHNTQQSYIYTATTTAAAMVAAARRGGTARGVWGGERAGQGWTNTSGEDDVSGARGEAMNIHICFSPLHSRSVCSGPPRLLLYTFFATASEFSRRSIIVITIIICLHQPVKLAKNYSISTTTVDSFVKNVRICLNIIQSLKAYRRNTHAHTHTHTRA